MTDPSAQLVETATYCKKDDELRPGLVGLPDFTTTTVCPEDGSDPEEVTSAYPDGWYVRIMFDELLDPNIEQLTPIIDDTTGEPSGSSTGSIAASHPVTLECESVNGGFVNVDYDGYYSPSGNRVTWPVGPSLVVKPNDPTTIGTNTECRITINAGVTDKSGVEVPAEQRGPFTFKIAPITAIVADPPVDDPDFVSPIDAISVYADNLYFQFNTTVDVASMCPDEDGDGNCDDESLFSIKDVDHPDEGPGLCDVTGAPCSTVADCDSVAGDTLCGRGFCSDDDFVCNKRTDCPTPDQHCNTNYVDELTRFGLTDTEVAMGPVLPIETDRKYIFQLNEGSVLTDRCGVQTTLGAPSAGALTLAHFATNPFDLNSTTIVTDEVASAMKRLTFNFNNVLGDLFVSGTDFTLTPSPKVMTADCNGTTCPTADIDPADLFFDTGGGSIQLAGHLQLGTEYTATVKAGSKVTDFYGVEYTFAEETVIKWKTQPNIIMTGISVRNRGALFGAGNNGTVTKLDSTGDVDFRFGFNASIDPTSFGLDDVAVVDAETGEPVPGIVVAAPSGCGDFATNSLGDIGACTMRVRIPALPSGAYTVTFKAGAMVKDIFGTAYTHAADTSINITIADPPAPKQCL